MTTRVEEDTPIIKSGIFNGFTTGAPLNIQFANSDVKSKDYEKTKSIPRPGHADFVASKSIWDLMIIEVEDILVDG